MLEGSSGVEGKLRLRRSPAGCDVVDDGEVKVWRRPGQVAGPVPNRAWETTERSEDQHTPEGVKSPRVMRGEDYWV